MKDYTEYFDHDDCPKCGKPIFPLEGVPDQTLRGCENCEHVWWEDLNSLPIHNQANEVQG